MKAALVKRFSPLHKTLSARNKLATWRQLKDVSAISTDFLRIVLDIPEITEYEKMDRYSRGLKSHIWETLCTKEYNPLQAIMAGALKVEAAEANETAHLGRYCHSPEIVPAQPHPGVYSTPGFITNC